MDKATETINWYNITKDIIIPLLGVIATVVIGIVIAMLLRSKEEKAKIKTLLIDNYMLYLNTRIKDLEKEVLVITDTILIDFTINYSSYFEPNANRHIPLERIKERREEIKEKLSLIKDEDANWSPYTFKFCFLLGKKSISKKYCF